MPRDKSEYIRRLSKTGDRPTTRNQEVTVEVLVDLLDVMDDVLQELKDIKEALQGT